MALKIKAPPKKAPHRTMTVLPAKKPNGLFADLLNQGNVSQHRSATYNKDKYFIHVSDLMQASKERMFCARNNAIHFHEERGKQRVRQVTPGMELIHVQGNALQDHITQKFIARSQYGHTLWGDWSCECGKSLQRHSLRPHALRCEECAGPVNKYKEIDIFDPEHNVTGHPDILLLWNEMIYVHECKSIDRASIDFDKIEAPLGDHTVQGTFYYWLLRKAHEEGRFPYPISRDVSYIYIDRSTKKAFFGHPYKEFTKAASDFSRIEPMLAEAKLLRDSLANNVLPPRICKTLDTTRAKNCDTLVSCFSRTKDRLDG